MDTVALRNWLTQPRTALVAAVYRGIRAHVASLRARGIDYYSYALLPGEPYDVSNIVAVTNREINIEVPPTDDQYPYYRLCVDEWECWDHDQFAAANRLLAKANKQFASMHSKDPSDYTMDKFELAHSRSLLDAILQGLVAAKKEGVFGDRKPFLVVWIDDSANTMFKSVRCLNSKAVYQEFKKMVGD